jgi:hypothetical protein
MKKVDSKCQLWRVDLIHRNGYHAPYQLIEVTPRTNRNEYKEAHNMVKNMNLRLLDFSDKWSFYLTKLDKVKINNKWIDS